MAFTFITPEREQESEPSGFTFVEPEFRPVSATEAKVAREQERFRTGITSAAEEAPVLAANVARGYQKGLLTFSDIVGDLVQKSIMGIVDPSGIRREVNPLMREFAESNLSDIFTPREPISGTTARDIAARAGQEAGVTAVPTGAILGAGARGMTAPVAQYARRAPGRYVAGETIAAGGAGAGAELAGDRGPAINLLAEAGGGAAPFAFGSMLENMFRAVFQRTQGKAATKLQLAAEDPALAAKLAAEDAPEGMTLGQVTGDTGLLNLERAIVRSHARTRNRFIDQSQRLNQSMVEAVEDALRPSSVGVEAAQEFMQGRINSARQIYADRERQAMATVGERLARLGPNLDPVRAQTIVRDELDRLYLDARDQERALFEAIPDDNVALRSDVSKRLRNEFRDEEPEDVAQLPSGVRALFTQTSGNDLMEPMTGRGRQLLPDVRLGRLQKLRSNVLETAREARRNSQFNRARIHEKAADALYELMTHQDVGASGPVRAALQFSRDLNERFTGDGPVADILGLSRGRTRPSTREQPLVPAFRGPEAGANVSAIRRAGQTPPIEEGTAEYVLNKFQDEVVGPKGNKLNSASLANWRRKNRALLSRFPAIDRALETTHGAQLIAERRLNELGDFDLSVGQAQRGRFKKFLEADPEVAVSVALSEPTRPRQFMRYLKNRAQDDPTGNAMRGLQRGVYDEIMNNVITPDGNMTLAKWDSFMNRRRKSAIREVFSGPQMRMLEQVRHDLQRAKRSQIRLPGGSDTIENASMMTNVVFRLAGAGLLRRVTRTLQGAAFGASAGSNLAKALENPRKAMLLLEKALFEPKVGADLLAKRVRRDGAWENRINGYLADVDKEESSAE